LAGDELKDSELIKEPWEMQEIICDDRCTKQLTPSGGNRTAIPAERMFFLEIIARKMA
jgi:hypothetical protein